MRCLDNLYTHYGEKLNKLYKWFSIKIEVVRMS